MDKATALAFLRNMSDEQFAELGGMVADELSRRAAARLEGAADRAVSDLWKNLKNRLKGSF